MEMQQYQALRFGAAGMRGIVGYGLTATKAIDYAAAFGTYLGERRVIVGMDSRVSSPMLNDAVISALTGTGCDVIDAGIIPCGMVHYAIAKLQLAGGLLIGGRHQSSGWNAIIPLDSDGAYFNSIRQRELMDIYNSGKYNFVGNDQLGRIEILDPRIRESYWNDLEALINLRAIRKANFTILADFANGSGALVRETIAHRWNLNLIAINDDPSGFLPRDPEPRPRTGSPIRALIMPVQAAAGLIFNSDMSRLEIVTDQGEPLSEEMTFPLLAAMSLTQNPSASHVVGNITSSRTLDDVVHAHNGILEKTRVGQAYVIDLFREMQYDRGGEGSGSFASSAWVKGFDAIFSMAVLLNYLAVSRKNLTQCVNTLNRYHIVKRAIPCTVIHAYALLRDVRRLFPDAEINEVDGIRFDWPDGFLAIRLSATDHILRLISEAESRKVAEEREQICRSFIERWMML